MFYCMFYFTCDLSFRTVRCDCAVESGTMTDVVKEGYAKVKSKNLGVSRTVCTVCLVVESLYSVQ